MGQLRQMVCRLMALPAPPLVMEVTVKMPPGQELRVAMVALAEVLEVPVRVAPYLSLLQLPGR